MNDGESGGQDNSIVYECKPCPGRLRSDYQRYPRTILNVNIGPHSKTNEAIHVAASKGRPTLNSIEPSTIDVT